jgi:glycosyltransferase involved in cell wall biosynthesis
MPHGMLDPYFQRAAGRKLKAIRNIIYWKLFEQRVINGADGLLFTCEEEMQLARTTFTPYRPKREMVVGLGVDEPPAADKSIDASLHKLGKSRGEYLLFMSRLHEKKGVHTLLHALDKVNAQKHNSIPLVVAGPGLETAYGKTVRSFAQEHSGTKDSVTFTGMVSGDFKWATLYNCDAFVLPSSQENFGIAVVEALACGRPVLISNKVNIWREIQAAQCGLIEEDTLEGTVAMLEKWLTLSAEEKALMGRRARKLYETSFSVREAALRMFHSLEIEPEAEYQHS